jgi:hypothetical protein
VKRTSGGSSLPMAQTASDFRICFPSFKSCSKTRKRSWCRARKCGPRIEFRHRSAHSTARTTTVRVPSEARTFRFSIPSRQALGTSQPSMRWVPRAIFSDGSCQSVKLGCLWQLSVHKIIFKRCSCNKTRGNNCYTVRSIGQLL